MNKQFFLFLFLIFIANFQETCWPEFILPNILKDSIILNYNDPNQNTYSYLYFAALLPGQVKIAYSISEIQIGNVFASLNYYVNAQITNQQILFKFNAPNYRWQIVIINFFLSSRNDLFITKHVISNIRSEQRTFNIPINNTLSLNTNDLHHVTFIVALFCNYTNNIELSVVKGDLSATNAIVYINAGAATFITNITIVSIIYSTSSSQFISISADLTFKSFQAQHYNIFKNFLPIYYYLIGLNSISLTEFHRKTFSYKFQLISLSIINATAITTFKNIIMSYIAISAFTSNICCGNFFSEDQCIDKCLEDAYPHTYSDGGKACIKCNPLIGLRLNQLSTQCSCLPNYELLTQNQCIPIKIQNITCKGINQIAGIGGCICSPGTVNISGICSSCPNNQVFQNGQCVTRIMEISCNVNQILQNNQCVCNSNSIPSGSECVACSDRTYVDKSNNKCSSCIENCLKCVNNMTCLQCVSGYSFDLSALKCFTNDKINRVAVNILQGFPKYTTRAVIIDFQINYTNYTIKSTIQLKRIIKTTFKNEQFAPKNIEYIQNPNKLNHIRLLLNYYGLYPSSQFTVSCSFTDGSIGLKQDQNIILNYNINQLAYELI